MMKIFPRAVFFVLPLLAACGSGDNNKSGGSAATPSTSAGLQASFQDFLGNYKVAACNASTRQDEYCRNQTVEVKIEDSNGRSSLLLVASFQSADGTETSTLTTTSSIVGDPDVSCQLSYGKSTCTAARPADHPGAYLNATFSKGNDGAVLYREEQVDPQHPENNLTLEFTLSKI
jgi:hypothetical protein